MAKKLEHKHRLDIEYSVVEDMDLEEIEYITVKVAEYNFDLEDEDIDIEEHQIDNYLELNFTRILRAEENGHDLFDMLDSTSGNLLKSIYPIMDSDKEEFMSKALSIETTLTVSKIIYLDSAKIHGDFNENALAAATSKAFKILSKGTASEEFVIIAYQNKTFFNNGVEIEENKSKDIIKALNLFKLPEVASGINKKDNILSIASGNTINFKCEEVYEYSTDRKKQVKI